MTSMTHHRCAPGALAALCLALVLLRAAAARGQGSGDGIPPVEPRPPNTRPARVVPSSAVNETQPPAEPPPAPGPPAPIDLPSPAPADLPPLPPGQLPPSDDFAEVSVLSLEQLLNQKLETATRTITPILQIPNRVEIITDDQIRRRGYRYLIELVEDLPGVQSMNYVEAETGAHVVVRGIWQNNKILVLYDGHKITSPEGKDFIFGRHNWSLANVKRVEFIYGPASALYGADAVSAVINIVPKDFKDLDGHHLEASAGYGLYNTVEADVAAGFQFNQLKVRVDGAFHRSDGPNFLEDYGDYYSYLRSPMYIAQKGLLQPNGEPVWVAPSISYHVGVLANLGENTKLQYLRIYSEEQSAMGFNPALFEFSRDNIWAWYQDNAGLTHELALSDDLTLRTLLTYNHQQCDPKTQFINNFFNDGLSFTRSDYKMFRSIRLGATEELVHTSQLFGHQLQLVLGARFEDIYSLSKISTTTGEPARLRYPINYQTNGLVPNGEVNFHALGGYFQAQYEPADRLNVVAGVNVDKVWHYETAFNPRVGATFAPVEPLTLRASVARAYLVPAPAYQFEGFNNAAFPGPGTIGAIPNPELEPEVYLTFETGLTAVLLHKKLLVDVSAFHTANDNYLMRQRRLVLDPMNRLPYTPGFLEKPPLLVDGATAVLSSENGGVVRAYGGELTLTGDPFDWLRMWGSYSLVLGRQTETPARTSPMVSSTDHLTNQASHQLKGGVQLQLFRRLFLVPQAVWYSRTRLRQDIMDETLKAAGLPPFFLMHLSAVWEADSFQVWARVQNLLDRHYYRPGGTVSQQASPRVPQAGVLGQAGIRVSY
jgi:outer membrane receptor protein involved in Fe transport